MRRSILLLMTVTLTAASIGMAMAVTTLERPQTTGTIDSASVSEVYRYYEAVNDMISTGDPASLRQVVHPELNAQNAAPEPLTGRDAIEDYLGYLHAVVPEIRIDPELVLGDGADVIAVVAVQRSPSSMPLGFLLEQLSMLWPSHERFLVSGGQIVARQAEWSEPARITRFDAFPTSFNLDPQRTLEVTLTQVEDGATGRFTTDKTPAILVMDSGNLRVTLLKSASDSAIVLDAPLPATAQTAERVHLGRTRIVGSGEVVVIPPESFYAIQNQWVDPAVLVTVSVAVRPVNGAESATFALFPQPGMHVRSLLTLPAGRLAAPSSVQFGSVSMPPGSRLTVDPATSLMAVWAESGDLVSTSDRAACAEAGYTSIPRASIERLHLICPGGAGEPAALVNAGNEPAAAWVIAVTTPS